MIEGKGAIKNNSQLNNRSIGRAALKKIRADEFRVANDEANEAAVRRIRIKDSIMFGADGMSEASARRIVNPGGGKILIYKSEHS